MIFLNFAKKLRLEYLIEILIPLSIVAVIYSSSFYNYLLFHGISEAFAILTMVGIFMVAWNGKRFMTNKYFLFLGISFLFVSFIDSSHTLAYKGMGVFPGYDSNLATQLWIGARYLQAISLLVAPLFIKRKLNVFATIIVYFIITSLILASTFYWRNFPTAYVEGVGLTDFKKISEYIISFISFLSILYIFKKRKAFNKNIFFLIILATVFTIFSELMFTLYVGVYSFFNLSGHLLKILAFYFFYKAIIETGLAQPFNLLFLDLKNKEKELTLEKDKFTQYVNLANVIFVVIDQEQKVILINKKGCEILGYREEEIIGKNWYENFIPERERKRVKVVFKKLITGNIAPVEHFENPILTKKGEERIISWHNTVIKDKKGKIISILSSGEDVTKKRQIEDELKESEERFKSIFIQSPIGIELFDKEGKMIAVNKASLKIFGIKKSSDVKGFDIFKDPNTSDFVKNSLKRGKGVRYQHIFDFEKVKQFKLHKTTKSGAITVDTIFTPFSKKGSSLGFLAQVREITKEKELEKRKDEFISIASHELKTPITSIKAFAQILERRFIDLSDDKSRYIINSLNEQTDKLTNLIRDLLDVGKIGEGKLKLKKEVFDLNLLIKKAIEDFSHTHESHKIELKGSLKKRIVGDEGRISQVLSNLLINAIKYSPNSKKIIVHVKSPNGKAVICVEDFGFGIRLDEQQKIFERFYRTEEIENHNLSGFGLGLYISKEIIKRHGGEMWVESREGVGSKFFLSLPYQNER